MRIEKSNLRMFAFIWAFVFLIVSIYPVFSGNSFRYWSALIAGVFTFAGFLFPFALKGFYRIWVKLGDLISGVVSRVIMFLLFYGMFTPVAAVLRILGKDLLNKKIDKQATSYWIERKKQPESMKNQF